MLENNREGLDQNIWLNIFRAVRSGIVAWWQQSYSAPPPPGMYCVSADGARWILFREGSSGREGRETVASRCYGREREFWPGSPGLAGEEGGIECRHNTYCGEHGTTRHNTHCREQLEFGGRSIAAVDQLGCVSRIKQNTADQGTNTNIRIRWDGGCLL